MFTISQRATPTRWWMLLIISTGLLSLSLNWFDIASAFPALSQHFHLQVPQLSLLIALFFAGNAIFHIPAGFLASRFGVKNIWLAGLLLESLAAIASAFAPTYGWLAFFRILTGIGSSLFVGCGFSLVTSWFRGRELALAMGIASGGGFVLGVALALFVWVGFVLAAGWSIALATGGIIGLLSFLISLLFLRVPDEEQERLSAGHLSRAAIGRVLGNRDLWLLGLSFFGLYGASLTLAQLLNTYIPMAYHVPETTSGLMAALFTLSAIPGSILGGFLCDRLKTAKLVMLVPWLLTCLGLIIFPLANLDGAWLLMLVLGGVPYVGYAAWASAPGRYKDQILPEDVATAEGLLLTISGAGGFAMPILFGMIVTHGGFTSAWIALGIISIAFALIGLAVREPLPPS